MKSKLLVRSISGAVFVVVLIGSIWPGFQESATPWLFISLFAIIAGIGLLEFYKIAKLSGATPQKLPGLFIGILTYYYFVHRNVFDFEQLLIAPYLSIIIFGCAFIFLRELFLKSPTPFQNLAFTFLGIVYVFLPFSLLVETSFYRNYYEPRIVLGIFFLIWANDTFAYLVGSLLGRTKLLERISPGKTWEGFIGGGLATLVLAWFLMDIFTFQNENLWHFHRWDWLIIGFLVFVFGTCGDLIESMLKRSVGIKDSGNVMAGHGGILDRFDSLIFVMPLIYAYLFLIKANLNHLLIFFNN
jgi:phosphatidate cytidylyltransferase